MTKTILIVEDDQKLREALATKLENQSGLTILQAENGEDALRQAEVSRPDLILLDIMMPKMDGMEFLQALRESDWGKELRVVILSNLSTPEKVSDAMNYDVFHYHIKSNMSLGEISDIVKEQLGN